MWSVGGWLHHWGKRQLKKEHKRLSASFFLSLPTLCRGAGAGRVPGHGRNAGRPAVQRGCAQPAGESSQSVCVPQPWGSLRRALCMRASAAAASYLILCFVYVARLPALPLHRAACLPGSTACCRRPPPACARRQTGGRPRTRWPAPPWPTCCTAMLTWQLCLSTAPTRPTSRWRRATSRCEVAVGATHAAVCVGHVVCVEGVGDSPSLALSPYTSEMLPPLSCPALAAAAAAGVDGGVRGAPHAAPHPHRRQPGAAQSGGRAAGRARLGPRPALGLGPQGVGQGCAVQVGCGCATAGG